MRRTASVVLASFLLSPAALRADECVSYASLEQIPIPYVGSDAVYLFTWKDTTFWLHGVEDVSNAPPNGFSIGHISALLTGASSLGAAPFTYVPDTGVNTFMKLTSDAYMTWQVHPANDADSVPVDWAVWPTAEAGTALGIKRFLHAYDDTQGSQEFVLVSALPASHKFDEWTAGGWNPFSSVQSYAPNPAGTSWTRTAIKALSGSGYRGFYGIRSTSPSIVLDVCSNRNARGSAMGLDGRPAGTELYAYPACDVTGSAGVPCPFPLSTGAIHVANRNGATAVVAIETSVAPGAPWTTHAGPTSVPGMGRRLFRDLPTRQLYRIRSSIAVSAEFWSGDGPADAAVLADPLTGANPTTSAVAWMYDFPTNFLHVVAPQAGTTVTVQGSSFWTGSCSPARPFTSTLTTTAADEVIRANCYRSGPWYDVSVLPVVIDANRPVWVSRTSGYSGQVGEFVYGELGPTCAPGPTF